MGRTDHQGRLDPTSPLTRFFHPVLPVWRLRRGPVQVWVAGQAFVLWRDRGTPRALVDVCPHRFAPLSAGRVRSDGRIQCPYHGWHFGADGAGASPSQPELGRCQAHPVQVVERHGALWLGGLELDAAALPELDGDGYTFAGVFDHRIEAPLHVALDNFSEDEHLPWVHSRLGWGRDGAPTVDFETDHDGSTTRVVYAGPQRHTRLRWVLGVHRGDTFHNAWTTRFDPVRSTYDMHWTAPSGKRRPIETRTVVCMVPETDATTRFQVFVHVKVHKRRLRPWVPAIGKAAMGLGWFEVRDDARFLRHVADTPTSMKGMRLGRFDRPLVHNRRLLERIYWGRQTRSPE